MKSFYKYAPNSKYTFQNLCNDEFYLASPNELNDIFEMIPYINLERALEQLKSTNIRLYNYEIKNRIIKEKYKKIVDDPDEFWKLGMNYIKGLKGSIRIGSLSEDGKSPIMWGLYAAQNSGVLIEYDKEVVHEAMQSSFSIHKVEYSTHRYDGFDDFITFMLIDECCITDEIENSLSKSLANTTKHKFIAWNYEKEHRILTTDINKRAVTLKAKSITLGYNMENSEKLKYIKLAKTKDIDIKYFNIYEEKIFETKSHILEDKHIKNIEHVVKDNLDRIYSRIISEQNELKVKKHLEESKHIYILSYDNEKSISELREYLLTINSDNDSSFKDLKMLLNYLEYFSDELI